MNKKNAVAMLKRSIDEGKMYPYRLTANLTDEQWAHVSQMAIIYGSVSDYIRELLGEEIAYAKREDDA